MSPMPSIDAWTCAYLLLAAIVGGAVIVLLGAAARSIRAHGSRG